MPKCLTPSVLTLARLHVHTFHAQDHKLGCPLPEELRLCGGSVPEDLSPRSLRSMFSHNTNLWLSKHPTLQPLEGHVGFVKLSDPPDTYMGK